MKKISILIFTLLISASTLFAQSFGSLSFDFFAEDAKTLPMMTARITAVPQYSFLPGFYDEDWYYQGFNNNSVKLFSLGLAFDMGLADWITAGVKWIPGWTPWSDTSALPGMEVSKIDDLSMGFKIQIVGERAPVGTSILRFAIIPSVTLPLSEDMELDFLRTSVGFYIDIIQSYFFSINLLAEGTAFPTTLEEYYLNFAFEPVFTLPLARGIDLSAGTAVKFLYWDPLYNLGISPNLSIFFKNLVVPMELKLQHTVPLMGRNSYAMQSTSLFVKTYFGQTSRAF